MALIEYRALNHEIGRDLRRASRERAEAAQLIATCADFNRKLPKTDVLVQEASELRLAAMDAHYAGRSEDAIEYTLREKRLVDVVVRVSKNLSLIAAVEESGIKAQLANKWPPEKIADEVYGVMQRPPSPKPCR